MSFTRHVGDFGNLEEDAAGDVQKMFSDPISSLFRPVEAIQGRGLVVRLDFTTSF